MKGFFISGTDTDVGKSVVTTLLTYYFKQQGKDIFPYKPIQSGAVEEKGKLLAPDVMLYQKILPSLEQKDANTYLLKKPSSPHLAAKEENIVISPDTILAHYQTLQENYDMLLVEGAGGLIVPIEEQGYCIIDLIEEISLPVILVARAGLGTLNHTALSVMALRQKGIPVAGILLNRLKKEDRAIELDNQKMIETLTGVPVLGVIPYLEDIEKALADDQLLNDICSSFKGGLLDEFKAITR